MIKEVDHERNNRYVNQSISDLELANKNPIKDYETEALVSLEEAMKKVVPLIGDVSQYIHCAKQKCYRDSDGLTWDESAAIYLYTMSTPVFSYLNRTLREENRRALKPWFPFLKLFLTGLNKVPSSQVTVWRAVAGDIGYSIIIDHEKTYIWWSINSSSTALNVVQNFLGETGTLFSINAINAKKIDKYSAFPDEKEVILPPGVNVRATSQPMNFEDRLQIVHLQQINVNNEILSSNESNETDGMNSDNTPLIFLQNQNQPTKRQLALKILLPCFLGVLIIGLPMIAAFVPMYFVLSSVSHQDYSSSYGSSTSSSLVNQKCFGRVFNMKADILYSFDCYNVTDDISGKYNGFAALTKLNNKSKSSLPEYVSPDYSNRGAAMKLDSDIKFEYIQLAQSPILLNRSFTMSVWIKPSYQTLKLSYLFTQVYQSSSFLMRIVDECIDVRMYASQLHSCSPKLKDSIWQYVTFVFDRENRSMSIYINGLQRTSTTIYLPVDDNSQVQRTTIGGYDAFNQYGGLIDQLSISFQVKSPIDILDEATLVVFYNFDSDFLFKDTSVNSNHAQGFNVSHLIDSRHSNEKTLILLNPNLSYFQSVGLVLHSTYNYSYSYSLWMNLTTMSSLIPLIHLVYTKDQSKYSINNCYSMLAVNRTDANTFQLLLFVYQRGIEKIIITATQKIVYSSWFHFVVVSGTDTLDLYVNGTLVASSQIEKSPFQSAYESEVRLTMTIGNPELSTASGNLYQSMCNVEDITEQSYQTKIALDNLRFYSRQLKFKEIQALVNDDSYPTRFFFVE